MSHGHIRIGTFQRLAYHRDEEGMRRLVAYVLRHFDGEEPGEDGAVRLLDHVVRRTARLAACYMAAGFVHGVLNSDNINVTGESFDYGPWRFAPSWDPGFTAAYFDHAGLYAFGRQPEAIHWDAAQLAISLRLLSEAEPLIAALEAFGDHYQPAVFERDPVAPGRPSRAIRRAIARWCRRSSAACGPTMARSTASSSTASAASCPPAMARRSRRRARGLPDYAPRSNRDHPYWRRTPPVRC